MNIKSIARKSSLKMGVHGRGPCNPCIHAVPRATSLSIQCRHPKVIEIENQYPERRLSLIAATALNKMGKALNLKVNPDAYARDPWFNWPWGYHPQKPSIVACSGFEKKHIKH